MQEGIICIFFCLVPAGPATDSYATQCSILRPSRSDTPGTLRQIAAANSRCRAAKARTTRSVRTPAATTGAYN